MYDAMVTGSDMLGGWVAKKLAENGLKTVIKSHELFIVMPLKSISDFFLKIFINKGKRA